MGGSVGDEPFAGYDAMNPEVKRQWVDALRSGKYQQGEGVLRHGLNGDKYCCLGVLCDVMAPDKWKPDEHLDVFWHDETKSVPSPEVRAKAGLLGGDLMSQLTYMNDVERQPFKDIADWIEANL